MFEVSVKSSFSAAHSLRDIGGKCENLHGHNFAVEVSIRSGRLTDHGVVIDFRELKSFLAAILEGLDHRCLNETSPFADRNPSSEHIARYIHDEMKKKIEEKEANTHIKVRVWESDSSCASYWEDET
jgi:6-pyruvoyltetrahydropterin/6-carboxytetrahydropterin synthase